MKRLLSLLVVLAPWTFFAGRASADDVALSRLVPPSGGLDALEVRVDPAAAVLRVRTTGAYNVVPIPLAKADIDVAHTTIESIQVGQGRTVVHVRVPDARHSENAFEALFSGKSDSPIVSGLTGYTAGEDGEKVGRIVRVYDRDSDTRFVLVADIRQDTTLCGQTATPLSPQIIDAGSMQLLRVSLHRLDVAAREKAVRVEAVPFTGSAPLASLLVATASSTPFASRLTDRSGDTFWSSQKQGDGHGEFVSMRAPSELPLRSFVLTLAPGKANAAAPSTVFLATEAGILHVTLPSNAKAGASYEIVLPKPIRTGCVSLVLDTTLPNASNAGVAELEARTLFDADGATLVDVARKLSSPDRDAPAALLRRAGTAGVDAILGVYTELDALGRALAVDVVASAAACDGASGDLLTRALADKDGDVRARAAHRIERCGKGAVDALATAVRSDDERKRVAAAPLLASIARGAAMEPLAAQMGAGSAETRRVVRSAFARSLASGSRETLASVLLRKDTTELARIDLLRAAGPRLTDARPEADAAIDALVRDGVPLPTHYLLVDPVAHLAASKDATESDRARLVEFARKSKESAVRVQATLRLGDVEALRPVLLSAARDPEPRVREAAFHALRDAGDPRGMDAALAASNDPWTFVRVAALDALSRVPLNAAVEQGLVATLKDRSPKVRVAGLALLATRKVASAKADVRERLVDADEHPDVRAEAARVAGVLCMHNALDALTKLATRAIDPVDEADERLGVASLSALGALHPADLASRLAPFREKSVRMPLRRLAERAQTEPALCRER
jgi:hypothetical protein